MSHFSSKRSLPVLLTTCCTHKLSLLSQRQQQQQDPRSEAHTLFVLPFWDILNMCRIVTLFACGCFNKKSVVGVLVCCAKGWQRLFHVLLTGHCGGDIFHALVQQQVQSSVQVQQMRRLFLDDLPGTGTAMTEGERTLFSDWLTRSTQNAPKCKDIKVRKPLGSAVIKDSISCICFHFTDVGYLERMKEEEKKGGWHHASWMISQMRSYSPEDFL